jgi:hypothetical protein
MPVVLLAIDIAAPQVLSHRGPQGIERGPGNGSRPRETRCPTHSRYLFTIHWSASQGLEI